MRNQIHGRHFPLIKMGGMVWGWLEYVTLLYTLLLLLLHSTLFISIIFTLYPHTQHRISTWTAHVDLPVPWESDPWADMTRGNFKWWYEQWMAANTHQTLVTCLLLTCCEAWFPKDHTLVLVYNLGVGDHQVFPVDPHSSGDVVMQVRKPLQ